VYTSEVACEKDFLKGLGIIAENTLDTRSEVSDWKTYIDGE